MRASQSMAAAAAAIMASSDGPMVRSPRLDDWKPKSMKTPKQAAACKKRRKIARASRRRNRQHG
jgi:hypothetical protein